MAIIGNFTAAGTGYVGTLETLALKAQVVFERHTLKAQVVFERHTKTKDNQPDYYLHSQGREIGAAWERVGFLSVNIDDPSFSPGNCLLKKVAAENRYELSFQHRRPKKDAE